MGVVLGRGERLDHHTHWSWKGTRMEGERKEDGKEEEIVSTSTELEASVST